METCNYVYYACIFCFCPLDLHTAASGRTLGVALAVEEEETVSLPVTCARGQVI